MVIIDKIFYKGVQIKESDLTIEYTRYSPSGCGHENKKGSLYDYKRDADKDSVEEHRHEKLLDSIVW